MSPEILTYEKREHLGIVLIHGLDTEDRISRLSVELSEICEEIALDDGIRVVVLSGTGDKPFVSHVLPVDESYPVPSSITEPVSRLEQPVIAAIEGDAVGLGLELILACDIRIATETSNFAMPQVRDGLIPWDGGTQRMARLVGRAKALELILMGDTFDAREALRTGLINRMVSPGQAFQAALDMARKMASMAPIALRYIKEAVTKGTDLTLEQGLRLEEDLYLMLYTTQDRTEGIRAFREKRPPRFEGR